MNCSKWALTLAELDASDLIRLASHSVQASSWRTGPPDTLSERERTQRAAACSGLRMIPTQDTVWSMCATYCMRLGMVGPSVTVQVCECTTLLCFSVCTCNNVHYIIFLFLIFTYMYLEKLNCLQNTYKIKFRNIYLPALYIEHI